MKTRLYIFLLSVCLAANMFIQARPVDAPQKLSVLWEEASLVAVIEPVSTQRTNDQLLDGSSRDPAHYQGLNTSFKVKEVLKASGPAAGFKEALLTLLHFAYRGEGLEFNGGLFIYFHLPPTAYAVVAVRESVSAIPGMREVPQGKSVAQDPPAYLAFLRQRKDGRFEPVTGNYDAAPSFRILSKPTTGSLIYATEGIPGENSPPDGTKGK